ncbi:MAG: hypothetical protein Q7R63_00470, partial [bacterium]|nr:hypothetical protein [bacterium]
MPYSTKTIKKISIILALVFAPFFFVQAQTASTASTDTLQSDLSRLTESLDLLNAIKIGRRPADTTSLQTALNNVITISEEEIRNVSVQLAAQNGLTDEESALRDGLMADLASLKLHAKAVRTDTTQESGISAVISLAQKLKEWRDGPYAATMRQVIQFVSVFENDASIIGANARFTAIAKDENKIRSFLALFRTTPFTRLMKEAQSKIKKAANLNARAKFALMPDPDTEESADGDIVDEM